MIRSLESCFNPWYLDDGLIGGNPVTISADLHRITEAAVSFGLHLNLAKCEVFTFGGSKLDRETVAQLFRKYRMI